MSERWPGGIVRSTPVTPTGPLQNGTAPGIWTMEQAAYWSKQGLWPTAGNFLAVEDVFSTFLYTGNGSTQTITNGINLSGQGGMVWVKSRSNATENLLYDTSRGAYKYLISSTTGGQVDNNPTGVSAFNSNGFAVAGTTVGGGVNGSGATYASWTFRKAPKFFDVVTYTGNGAALQTINHNLGVAPGTIFVKQLNGTDDWAVYHRSTGKDAFLFLNSTMAVATGATDFWGTTAPNATSFQTSRNNNGGTYVAYLFAHDTTSDGIIQCGSFTTDGSGNATVNLGWEPQWVMVKGSSNGGAWWMNDAMRGMPATPTLANLLQANSSSAEVQNGGVVNPTSTGFTTSLGNSGFTYIYIAIRRGPMRTPTLGTSVFAPFTFTGNGTTTNSTTNFPVDLMFDWTNASQNFYWMDRLRGSYYMQSDRTWAEVLGDASNGDAAFDFANNVQSSLICPRAGSGNTNKNAQKQALYNFRRAPSFFDEVCYTGTGGSSQNVSHNLGAFPELIIAKSRSGTGNWSVSYAPNNSTAGTWLRLNSTNAAGSANTTGGVVAPFSSTIFQPTNMGTGVADVNASGTTYVAYLFASCPGVSKVGSYTGTGATQTINCGFTTGARFVLIKRTDSTGDWYVWDSARGIVAGNDPYLLLNSTAAEVTSTDYIDTDNSGFQIDSTAPAGINANGGSYIFLAIS